MDFRKSTYSSAQGGACVEVGRLSAVAVRDTTQAGQPGRTVVEFSDSAWTAFLAAVR